MKFSWAHLQSPLPFRCLWPLWGLWFFTEETVCGSGGRGIGCPPGQERRRRRGRCRGGRCCCHRGSCSGTGRGHRTLRVGRPCLAVAGLLWRTVVEIVGWSLSTASHCQKLFSQRLDFTRQNILNLHFTYNIIQLHYRICCTLNKSGDVWRWCIDWHDHCRPWPNH